MENWNMFINEMLMNKDNGNMRSVEPFEADDKKDIIPLSRSEALIIWSRYFSDTIKYALLFEHTYGEPVETSIFDENMVDLNTLKKILRTLHDENTPILIYWNENIAIQTTWKMLTKYWNNFFYYPEDAIIFVNQEQVYFYNEMMLKKTNKLRFKSVPKEQAFKCLQNLKEDRIKKAIQIDSLFDGVSPDLHEDLYHLFHIISEGFKTIDNEEISKKYMNYCMRLFASKTEKIILTCNPYNINSEKYLLKILDDNCGESKENEFYGLLKELIAKK